MSADKLSWTFELLDKMSEPAQCAVPVTAEADDAPRCKFCKKPIEDDVNGFCDAPGDPCWTAWCASRDAGPEAELITRTD